MAPSRPYCVPMTKRLASLALLLSLACAAFAPFAGAHGTGHYSPLIVIPKLGVHQEAQASLATGPIVYYYDKATGTIGIAGHNVTPVAGYNGHGPFHFLKFMHIGDDVYVNHVHYRVKHILIRRPTDTSVLDFHGIVLSACYPDHSANWRTIVQAAPVS
jgi:sortase (surface protein transpeptidase)